jgi:hypothetical protein
MLDGDDLADFEQLCRSNPTYEDLRRWLLESPVIQQWMEETGTADISISSIQNWWQQRNRPGTEAESLNATLELYRGVDPLAAHQAALFHVVKLSDFVLGMVNQPEDLETIPPLLLSKVVDLLREQRQSAQALQDRKVIRDKRSLILSGGYRLVELLQKLLSDPEYASIRPVMDSLFAASLAQLEKEVIG